MKFLIIFIISLFLVCSVLCQTPNHYQFYRIQNPDRGLLNDIERSGGIVDRFHPGQMAEVYLTERLADEVTAKGYIIQRIDIQTLAKMAADTLSDDHEIGYSYHTYDAVTFILDSLAQVYSDICRLSSLGLTSEGREMWAVLISAHPELEEQEPEVKYVGAMHGNETMSQEMMLYLIDYLLQNYDYDDGIKNLVENTEIWIVPNMNFDGTQRQIRFNANGIDLNRNFPDRDPYYVNPNSIQAETQNIINWSEIHNFVLSANFHSGALLANYPWDKNLPGEEGYAATPDDATFRRLALNYSTNNPPMYQSQRFENGISNGAMWYEVSGSMQDWNYHYKSCMEFTIELSDVKTPAADSLVFYWNDNRESMITLLEQVHSGVHGTIKDSLTLQPLQARITVLEIGKPINCDPDFGDYYRLLEEGNYRIKYEAAGYHTKIVNEVQIDSGQITILDVLLSPIETYTFSGQVRDSVSGQPLAEVGIYIYQNNICVDSIRSDLSGNFSRSLIEGDYLINIYQTGYYSQSDSLHLYENINWDVYLTAIKPGLVTGLIRLMGAGSISGTVVYCQGKTDTLGSLNQFRIDSLLAGPLHIFAYKFDYRTSHIDTILNNGDSLYLELELWPGDNEYFTDFEDGNPIFTGSGDWQFGINSAETIKSFSGSHLWATVLSGDYSAGVHLDQLETPIFSIQGMVVPLLDFYHYFDIEEKYDGGNLKISVDEGKSWQILRPSPDYPLPRISDEYGNPLAGQPAFSGQSAGWEHVTFDLTEYINQPFLKFRFDFGTDEQKVALGWYIDDFKIFDANATEIFSLSPGYTDPVFEVSIFPNPANPSTKFAFRSATNQKISIFIYNIAGQRINEWSFDAEADRPYEYFWKGLNRQNQPVASGVYLVEIAGQKTKLNRKIILIR